MLDRIFVCLLCAALGFFPALASAQSPIGSFPPGAFGGRAALTPGGAPAYQGPGDVQSGWVFFRSCRAFSAAKAGTKAYNIIRASDGANQDINSLSNGSCDTITPVVFCAATTCNVFYYDQSGANACSGPCDSDFLTVAPWTASVLNGFPCSTNQGGATTTQLRYGASANSFTLAAPFTSIAVAIRTGSFTTAGRIIASSSANSTFGFRASTNTVGVSGGSVTETASDNAWHSLIGAVSTVAGQSAVSVDGTANTGTATTTGYSATFIVEFSDNGGSAAIPMNICESGLLNVALASGQYGVSGTLQLNVKNFWGTP